MFKTHLPYFMLVHVSLEGYKFNSKIWTTFVQILLKTRDSIESPKMQVFIYPKALQVCSKMYIWCNWNNFNWLKLSYNIKLEPFISQAEASGFRLKMHLEVGWWRLVVDVIHCFETTLLLNWKKECGLAWSKCWQGVWCCQSGIF